MIKALLAVRFRAFFAALTAQGRQKKKRSPGVAVFFIILYIYLAAVICGMMGMTFHTLAGPYHEAGLDWLYFAMAGLMGLGFAIVGSVFTTQSQLYDAKDNAMLLAMPIPPRTILLSRMVPLMALNLLFAGVVMVPAMVVYAAVVEASAVGILLQLLSLLVVTVIAQAISCLLGWGLHLLLGKLNKSFASLLYMVVFFVIYFTLYSQAGNILNELAVNGSAYADLLRTWVWPLYAMGQGCLGQVLPMLAFAAIGAGLFAAVYLVLSVTFLRTAAMQRKSKKKRKLDLTRAEVRSPSEAVIHKELKKFLGCPVYLTNMGLGLIMAVALTAAGLIFKNTLLAALGPMAEVLAPLVPLLICGILGFLISTMCVSTPSVSLEGKNIWILKSMPLSSKTILDAKLGFHCRLTVPVSMLAGPILSLAYGCGWADAVLTALVPGLLALLCGIIGMLAGLHWAKLDYISEAYPCKQSLSVLVTMLLMMGVPLVFGILYFAALASFVSVTLFLALAALVLAGICFGLYRVMIRWGTKKWESL